MRVLADANPIFSSHLTGIGYYTDELLNALARQQGIDLEGYAFNLGNRRAIRRNYVIREQQLLPGKLLTYPRHAKIDLPLDIFFRGRNYDVVMGTNFLVPPSLKKVPIVTTVHDLSFMDHPEWVQGKNGRILRAMLPKTLHRASGVVVISEFTGKRLRDVYGYDGPLLQVAIPPKKSHAGEKKPAELEKIGTPYFLFVGTIEPRKNIKTLLDAYESLPKSTQDSYKLVIAGKPGWDPITLERLRDGRNTNVCYLDYVTEAERNWLYKNAVVTVVPSHYEGFGMMTLESLDTGTPVITSDIPPQREILGNKGIYFSPLDTGRLTELLESFTNIKYRSKIAAAQKGVLKNYTWEDTAQKVRDFLFEVA